VEGGEPYFPFICRRVLNGDMSIPMTFVIFDVLRRDGIDLTSAPYCERRQILAELGLDGRAWTTCEASDDGRALLRPTPASC
jgi:ATP-dependent DNA ligase